MQKLETKRKILNGLRYFCNFVRALSQYLLDSFHLFHKVRPYRAMRRGEGDKDFRSQNIKKTYKSSGRSEANVRAPIKSQ